MSIYETYGNGTIRLQKIKTDDYHDLYRCVGCWKSWKSSSKKMGHKESSCKKYR